MKFELKGPFRENVYNLMRRVGYHFQGKDKTGSEFSFVYPPSGYPRFHIYLKEQNNNLIFNLHLDQKKPSYQGAAAHSAEYDNELIEKEVQRLTQEINKNKQ